MRVTEGGTSPEPLPRNDMETVKIDPLVGTRVGEYDVLQLIARGDSSVVYLAEHSRLKRRASLKVLSPTRSDGSVGRRHAFPWERLAKLEHPNIVSVYEVNESAEVPHIAREYVNGESLAETIERKGPLAPDDVLQLLDQVASALGFAHDRGIVHGDLKPHNVLVASGGDLGEAHVYVSDFAVISEEPGPVRSLSRSRASSGYLAPEQASGDPVDARTDVYALGCVLFEALTGSPPFAPDVSRVESARFEQPLPSARERRPDLPAAIDAVLGKALADRKEDRFETPADVVAAAREILVGPQLKLPEPGMVLGPNDAAALSQQQIVPPPAPPDAEVRGDVASQSSTTDSVIAPVPTAPDIDVQPASEPLHLPEPPRKVGADRRAMLLIAIVLVGVGLAGIAGALSWGEDFPSVAARTAPAETPATPTLTGGTGSMGAPEPPLAPVEAPVDVEVAFIGVNMVRIEWESPREGARPVAFLVLRDGERIGRVTQTFYRDTDVGPGERHAYRIVSVGDDGSTARSQPVIAILAPEPVEPPPSSISQAPQPQPSPPPPTQQCEGIVVGDDCLG